MKTENLITRGYIINCPTENSILIQKIQPYFKSLYIYYKAYYNCEPILVVTSVFNAAQYGKIVPENEYNNFLEEYTKNLDSIEDITEQIDLINFQSKLLKHFIN